MKCKDAASIEHSSPETTAQRGFDVLSAIAGSSDVCHSQSTRYLSKPTDYQCKSHWLKFFVPDVDLVLIRKENFTSEKTVASNLMCKELSDYKRTRSCETTLTCLNCHAAGLSLASL